jgi:hypothetical protein
MPKGVTNTERVILTRRELNMLRDAGRFFDKPRVTLNNLSAFRLAHEDLRDIEVRDLAVLELVTNN